MKSVKKLIFTACLFSPPQAAGNLTCSAIQATFFLRAKLLNDVARAVMRSLKSGKKNMVDTSFTRMQSVYFSSGPHVLFGWLHIPGNVSSLRGAAVICAPLGHEYMFSHRSVRALANNLASNGIPTLRFDYRSTGDSSGEDTIVGPLDGFIEDIVAAIGLCKRSFGEVPITLIGIGLGGTFAALTCVKAHADFLVLWGARVDGRKFIRSLRVLSNMLNRSTDSDEDIIDAAGMVLPIAMANEFEEIDLRKIPHLSISSALILGREDTQDSALLFESLRRQPFDAEYKNIPGYIDMVALPTETKVPAAAVEAITQWVTAKTPNVRFSHDALREQQQPENITAGKLIVSHSLNAEQKIELEESPVNFGPEGKLFGVLTELTAADSTDCSRNGIVFVNCGAEHHVGPHRLYTNLARVFAAQGYACFRIDIEGIGDSPANGGNEDNDPYSPVAMQDITAALDFLREQRGCRQFLMVGICSGAYHSFKAAVTIKDFNIVGAVLINQMVFQWGHDSTGGESDNEYYEMLYRKRAFFVPRKWLQFFSDGVDFRRVPKMTLNIGGAFVKGVRNRISTSFGRETSKLSSDMRLCFSSDRRIWAIFSEGEPGHSLLTAKAAGATTMGLRKNLFFLDIIKQADHGFSKSSMRKHLIELLGSRIDLFFEGQVSRPACAG